MRLLNTTEDSPTLEEVQHHGVRQYAILSHTWVEGEEVTFRQLSDGNFDRTSSGWLKIHEACRIARSRSCNWIWIDTVCIDKSSSTEVNEAINSMFDWYRNAEECYAFIDDLSEATWLTCTNCSKQDKTPFTGRRWFGRGWTLQELLAPKRVIFYCRNGNKRILIGSRDELSNAISLATNIGEEYLKETERIKSATIARRMSWAASRTTTKPEDAAYSLLGLFDVTMPLLYGEGERAFMRLQITIIEQSTDDTIFAWGIYSHGHLEGMLAPSVKDFEDSRDVFIEPDQGLPPPKATSKAVVHTSIMSPGAAIRQCYLGVSRPAKFDIRL